MNEKEARAVLESLRELIADPQIDFGPAYEMAKRRQQASIRIMESYLQTLRSKK